MSTNIEKWIQKSLKLLILKRFGTAFGEEIYKTLRYELGFLIDNAL